MIVIEKSPDLGVSRISKILAILRNSKNGKLESFIADDPIE